jgi:hypothetical protein
MRGKSVVRLGYGKEVPKFRGRAEGRRQTGISVEYAKILHNYTVFSIIFLKFLPEPAEIAGG